MHITQADIGEIVDDREQHCDHTEHFQHTRIHDSAQAVIAQADTMQDWDNADRYRRAAEFVSS